MTHLLLDSMCLLVLVPPKVSFPFNDPLQGQKISTPNLNDQ